MDTLQFILDTYKLSKEDKSPIKMYCTRWGTLPRLFRRLGFVNGAEIGVAGGRFSKFLCMGNPKLDLYAIDPYQVYPGYKDNESQQKMESLYKEAKERLAPYNCEIFREWSMEAVKMFPDESLDFVFIDANHDYEHVSEDIREWSKKVRPGGIVAGHDYIDEYNKIEFGVKLAVDEWMKQNSIEPWFILEKDLTRDPCPTWMYVKEKNSRKGVTRGILYYTDNRLDPDIMKMCQEQLAKTNLPITSVSLMPINFGKNIVFPGERGYLTMARQIVTGLENMTEDIVFFAEHDVLYHPSHFDFTPTKEDVYYYNTNSWMLRSEDGHCLYYDHRSLSGMCGFRKTLLKHYRERVRRIEELEKSAVNGIVKATSGNDIPLKEGIHRLGFEPGTHSRPERIDYLPAENFRSKFPNVDIKHKHNLTKNRWRIDQFRDKSVANTWKEIEGYKIVGWGRIQL